MKIRQAIAIEGATLSEYVNAYNKAQESLMGCEILSEERIDKFSMIVYYIKDAGASKPLEEECSGCCEQCRYFQYKLDRFGEIDRRYKFGTCEAAGGSHVNKSMRPCSMYKEK